MPRAGPTGRQNPVGSFAVSTFAQRSRPRAVKGSSLPNATARFGVYGPCHKPFKSGAAACWPRASVDDRTASATAVAPSKRTLRVSISPLDSVAEDAPATLDSHRAQIGEVGAVTGEEALHGDHVADLERVLSPSGAIQRVRRAAF